MLLLDRATPSGPPDPSDCLITNGSCFTPKLAKACADLDAEYRHTSPYTPRTNGMVEQFTSGIEREVLGITI